MDDLYLVSRIKEGLWLPHLYQKNWNATSVEDQSDRELYLQQVIQEIAKIITAVHRVAKVPRPLLWENVAVYIYWLYETRLKDQDLTLLQQKKHGMILLTCYSLIRSVLTNGLIHYTVFIQIKSM